MRYEKLPEQLQGKIEAVKESKVPVLVVAPDNKTIFIFSKDYASAYAASIGFISALLAFSLTKDTNESKSRF